MEIVEKIQSDFTAEITGTLLADRQPELNKILIERLGNNMRGKSKDINAIRTYEGLYDLQEHTVIESCRQSIYEALPEHYFHPPTLGGIGKPDEEIVDEIRKQRIKENDARQFFRPFEQEPVYLQIQALLNELAIDKKASNNKMLHLFEQGWPIIKQLPKRCALAYVYLLPIMHQMRGDKDWTEKCFSFITGFPVTITEDYRQESVNENESSFILGESLLGVNTCMGGTLNDGLYKWNVLIGPVPKSDITKVIPPSGFENLMHHLIRAFTPVQLFTQWEILTEKEGDTILSPDDPNEARLGYTFYL